MSDELYKTGMTPAEYGRALAAQAPPLSDAQIEAAARILAGFTPGPELTGGGRREARRNDGS